MAVVTESEGGLAKDCASGGVRGGCRQNGGGDL